MKSRSVILLLFFLAVIPCATSAATTFFRDVESGQWFASYVAEATRLGFISGYKDASGNSTGFFGPGNVVTIAEMAKMVSLSQDLIPVTGVARDNFPSSWKTHWAYDYLLSAGGYGKLSLRKGDKELSVTEVDLPATRGEVAHIIGMSYLIPPYLDTWQRPYLGTFHDVPKNHRFRIEIEYLANLGLLTGDLDANGKATGAFRPDDSVNRAEAVKMIMGARELDSQK